MPLNGAPNDDDFWAELPTMHRQLTRNQWEVVARFSAGQSPGEIAQQDRVSERAIRLTLERAGERIFSLTPYPASDASLGAWTHAHIGCCRSQPRRAA